MKAVTKLTATTLSAAALFGILSLTPAAVAAAATPPAPWPRLRWIPRARNRRPPRPGRTPT